MSPSHSLLNRAFGTALVATLLAVAAGPAPALRAQDDANQVVPANAYKDLKWRSVGATRGGRVTAYSGVRQQPHTFYLGATGGGVWKTDDAGITWVPIERRPDCAPGRSARSTWRRRTPTTSGSARAARPSART